MLDDGTGKQTNGLFSVFSYVRLQNKYFLKYFIPALWQTETQAREKSPLVCKSTKKLRTFNLRLFSLSFTQEMFSSYHFGLFSFSSFSYLLIFLIFFSLVLFALFLFTVHKN